MLFRRPAPFSLIINSTDFRQFQEYRNLTGLDVRLLSSCVSVRELIITQIAVVGGSYLYHTRGVGSTLHPRTLLFTFSPPNRMLSQISILVWHSTWPRMS